MASAESPDFDTWISERFVALNTDEAVFAPYVKSIVEGDETLEEKIDALDGILSELGDGSLDVEAFRQEILSRWEEQQKSVVANGDSGGDSGMNLESKLESILKMNDNLPNTQASSVKDSSDKGGKGSSNAPDSALRAAILNQYQDSDDDDLDAQGSGSTSHFSGGGGGGSSGLERNTNAERVQSEIKDRREREKEESAKKREKDREDRAKQKQQAQERKDKAKKKATKVERKR